MIFSNRIHRTVNDLSITYAPIVQRCLVPWSRPIRFGSRGLSEEVRGAIHSTKLSGNFGPKLNGSVRSNRKSFGKTGPPFEVVLFSRSDRLEFWLNGSRPRCTYSLRSRRRKG